MERADVAVVGGGPAGSATAITLARRGLDVTLIDKATFPRDKCCGDGLTAGALRLLEDLGLDPAAVETWQPVDDVVVRSPSGHEVTFPLPRGEGHHAVVSQRRHLDHAMLDLARSSGVSVREGRGLAGAHQDDDRVVLETDDGRAVHARYAVAADGMWSPLRRSLGAAIPNYRGEWHAFRQYFSRVGPRAARELFVWFEPDFLPGYVWSFPLPGSRANVGFGIQRGEHLDGAAMKKLWPDILARPHIAEVLGPDAEPESAHRAWPIPARVDSAPRSRGRALFVGDALTAPDPLTGEGIGQALLSGVLAAEAIADAGPFDTGRATRAYTAAIDSHLVADHKMSMLLIRALQHRKGARFAVRLAGASGWTRRNFGRWLFEDYPRAVAVTPGRWHRGMFTPPGAFTASDAGAGP
jgi:geranylgeranyl reductase family protein